MKYEFFKLYTKLDLSKEKYGCIELAFFEVFKSMLMKEKYIADEFKTYCLQYHQNYNWLNFMDDFFVGSLLEVSSRELHLSQLMSNSDNILEYNYNDSFFFGRMVGDFLIRTKKFSVLRCDKKEFLTALDKDNIFNTIYNINYTYKRVNVAPIKKTISQGGRVVFKRTNFSYSNEGYIYNPNDMCSYLGGYPADIKVFKKTN